MKNIKILFAVLLSISFISVCFGQEKNQSTSPVDKIMVPQSMELKGMVVNSAMPDSVVPASKAIREITDLETSISQAVKDKDSTVFGKFLSRDFQAIYDSGILNKYQEIQRVQKIDLKNIKGADEKLVFPADNVAILTYKTSPNSINDGKDIPGIYNVSSTFVKHNGKWFAVEHMMVKAAE